MLFSINLPDADILYDRRNSPYLSTKAEKVFILDRVRFDVAMSNVCANALHFLYVSARKVAH